MLSGGDGEVTTKLICPEKVKFPNTFDHDCRFTYLKEVWGWVRKSRKGKVQVIQNVPLPYLIFPFPFSSSPSLDSRAREHQADDRLSERNTSPRSKVRYLIFSRNMGTYV